MIHWSMICCYLSIFDWLNINNQSIQFEFINCNKHDEYVKIYKITNSQSRENVFNFSLSHSRTFTLIYVYKCEQKKNLSFIIIHLISNWLTHWQASSNLNGEEKMKIKIMKMKIIIMIKWFKNKTNFFYLWRVWRTTISFHHFHFNSNQFNDDDDPSEINLKK